jgi:C4-dicarboxylate transporter
MDLLISVCVCVCVGTYLVKTMSWNVLEVVWKTDLFVECVVVSCQLHCD